MTTETIEQRAERLVRQEVHYCVSTLVSTLGGMYASSAINPRAHPEGNDLCERAAYFHTVPDYESAAREAGWEKGSDRFPFARNKTAEERTEDDTDGPCIYADSWEEACELDNLEPYDREVFEHWIVSAWLADKLEAQGEKVERDFAGMTIWARTTTGQAIYADAVIEAIAKALTREAGE
jgi:hypothetical protein